ncbi:MAG: acyltransferase family protein [Mycobacteriaceae bacterium]|nr:acyltransferase family protein [Mycobacteriaceae bacterium]
MAGVQRRTPDVIKWDPAFTKKVNSAVRPVIRGWHRPEVRGVEQIPSAGGALLVSNHSGGMFTPDVLVFATAYYDTFGFDRPLYTLAHYGVFMFGGPLAHSLRRLGAIHADRENAASALRSGGLVLVFPGGDYDCYRPTLSQNVIDFDGRTGYVRTAIEAGVPLIPMVSIGAQETQLFLTRGNGLAKRLGLTRFRINIVPVSFGLPWGLSVILPPNLPLPSKIVTQVLPPIDIAAQFGEDPDVDEVDAHVRSVMQTALDRLGRKRRLPITG